MRVLLGSALLFVLFLPDPISGQQETAASRAGQELEKPPAPPLSEDSRRRLWAGLDLLARGNIRKAGSLFRQLKLEHANSLPEILSNLLDAYSEFERHLPNQVRASQKADRFLNAALWHARQAKVDAAHYRQILRMIRDLLKATQMKPPRPQLRALLCNLRMLSGDKATDGESIRQLTEATRKPEKIFFPIGPYTDAARKARTNGVIISSLVIDSEGCVGNARIKKGLPHGLNESMMRAFAWWSFEPAEAEGLPIAVDHHMTTRYGIQ